MNKLNGTITSIQKSGSIILVDIDVEGNQFSAMLIDSGEQDKWLQTNSPVALVFKETEVSLAVQLSGKLSMRNRMSCIVKQVERGQLLSKVELSFCGCTITSVVTTRAANSLAIEPGDTVEALVKANDVALMREID
jgi:molybdate transport system regulatory protein